MSSLPPAAEPREPPRAGLVAVVLAGLVLHGAALSQAWDASPLARHLMADAEVYWTMAGRIAGTVVSGCGPGCG